MKLTIIHVVILLFAFILRMYRLDTVPPSLSWDEASLGYNAHAIATSGTDEHGEKYPLARFEAFGDYKPPGYIYAAAPFVSIAGFSEISVRLPSVLAGLLMVVITYYLTKELFGSGFSLIALLAALLLTVSPWALQFSRGAYESNLAVFFNLLGVYLFIKSLKSPPYIVLSVVSFILSFYTFNANRIIGPLLWGTLTLLFIRSTFKNFAWHVIATLAGLILLIPSIIYLQTPESKLRFQEVSIFTNLQPVISSNERIAREGGVWWAKLLYNRRVLFATDYLKHYFDNFSLRFLFTHGDVNPRLSIQEMGMLYVWEIPLLLTGVYLLITRKHKALPVLISWMLIAPLPAGVARETPHALRILSILPTYQIIAAYGLYEILKWLKLRVCTDPFTSGESIQPPPRCLYRHCAISTIVSILFAMNIYYYLHNYFVHYPMRWSGEWQFGYKEMVAFVFSVKDQYDHIFVTEAQGRAYIYFLFWGQIPVERFTANREAQKDAFGFWEVKKWENITFGLNDADVASGNILVVTTPGNIPGGFKVMKEVKNLSGDTVFVIAVKA